MAPSCSPGATGTTRKTWTRQERDNRSAHVQQLEAENKHLRELNQSIAFEKNQAIRVCEDLAKQNVHLRSCLERLGAGNANRFPETPEALQATHSSHTYHAHNSSHVAAVSIPADSAPLVPSGGTDSQLQIDGPPLPRSEACQPLPRQPVSSLDPQGEKSPVSMRSGALLASSRIPEHVRHDYTTSSLVDNTRQTASPRQSPRRGSQTPQLRPVHESHHSKRPSIELSLQDDPLDHERCPSSPAGSDASMQSVLEQPEENSISADDAGNESSDDSSSSGETDDDSDGKSGVDSFTSRDTSEEAIKSINSQTKFTQGLVSDVRPSNSITNPGRPSSRAPDPTTPIPQGLATSTASSPATARDVYSSARQLDPQTDVELEAAIRENYARFGLSAQRLKFCYEPQPLDPTTINLGTNWKRRSNLNESMIEKLNQAGSEISAFFPESDAGKTTKRETDLIHRLCKCDPSQAACGSLKDVVGALRQEQNVTKDELNLIEFELYSTLIVMKSQSESEFEETIATLSDYQCNLLGMYNSLHVFIAHLNQAWDGLHLLVLIYMLRVGASRLLKYFVPTTRPAAIELLLRRFGNPQLMAKSRERVYQLIHLAGSACAAHLRQTTPLKRLQDRMAGITDPFFVRAALGYSDEYQNGTELNSLPLPNPTPDTIERQPQTVSSQSKRRNAYNNSSDQANFRSASETHSHIGRQGLTSINEQALGGRSPGYGRNIEAGVHGSGPIRKRQCEQAGVNSHGNYGASQYALSSRDFGGPLTNESFLEPRNQRKCPRIGGNRITSECDTTEAALVIDGLSLNPNTVTDLELPWSRMSPVPNESINIHTETEASQNEIYAAADANNQGSDLDFFSLMQFDSPQRASPTVYGGQVNQLDDRRSLAINTPQQVIGSMRDGTIDPRTLEFRS